MKKQFDKISKINVKNEKSANMIETESKLMAQPSPKKMPARNTQDMKLKSRTDSYFNGLNNEEVRPSGKDTKLSMHELYFRNERQKSADLGENIDVKNESEGKPQKAFSDDSSHKRYEVEQNESDMSNEDSNGGALSKKVENLEEYKRSQKMKQKQ